MIEMAPDVTAAREAKFVELQEKKAEEKKQIELEKIAEKASEAAKPSGEGKAKEDAKPAEEKKADGGKVGPKKEEKGKEGGAKREEGKKEEKKEEKKREITLERIYTIPLVSVYSKPLMSRGNAAIKVLRKFLVRHMKGDEKKIKLTISLNNLIRKRGSARPMKKIKVKATKDKEGIVLAEIAA